MSRTEPDECDDEVSADEIAHLLDEVRELRREIDTEALFETEARFEAEAPFEAAAVTVPAAAVAEALAHVERAARPRPATGAPVALQPPPLTLLPRSRDGAARVLVLIAVVASLLLLAQAYLFTWSR